ncbi:hypothetical protein SAMN06298226_2728 [Nitrosovibrio sp. Nv4]|nr:hypothetical protein SAMN06298226_2728 [Nitrosovibrio sp. Nv4]
MDIDPLPIGDILPCIDINDAGWGGSDVRKLLCPVCSGSYNHMEPSYLKDGGDNYDAKWGGRGDLTVVPMWGECGSKWEVCIGFHKGESFMFTRVSQSCKDQKNP